MIYNCELWHYASEYYDPVKAHEYYEEHKKLKGRQKPYTGNFNQKGTEAEVYVKKKIDEEHGEKWKEATKKKYQDIYDATSSSRLKIAKLRHMVRHMTKEEKMKKADSVLSSIKDIRKDLETAKEEIRKQYTESIKTLDDNYKDKYYDELEKMVSDKSFTNN